ncbi:MAG: transglutaminase family protein [Caldilineales bacterium]|nr:transglutaminase family protein [Caldilineales bacterium]
MPAVEPSPAIYRVRHITRFRYSTPVRESMMEVRLHPRSDNGQRCLDFRLRLDPTARQFTYIDHLGNAVHHFDIPTAHTELTLSAETLVAMDALPALPDGIGPDGWRQLDEAAESGQFWEFLGPSEFARPSPLLARFMREIKVQRNGDPLALLCRINSAIYAAFEYVPDSTQVDSPIDHALSLRKGVCQDFTHIMIAMVRSLGVPCRYVSGYLFHQRNSADRAADDATHAWLDAWLPGIGWLGFDPTNNTLARERHIMVAVGRDYADVTPTRGVYKGDAESELSVAVQVYRSGDSPPPEPLHKVTTWSRRAVEKAAQIAAQSQQQ